MTLLMVNWSLLALLVYISISTTHAVTNSERNFFEADESMAYMRLAYEDQTDSQLHTDFTAATDFIG
jgi:hypothetical protein